MDGHEDVIVRPKAEAGGLGTGPQMGEPGRVTEPDGRSRPRVTNQRQACEKSPKPAANAVGGVAPVLRSDLTSITG